MEYWLPIFYYIFQLSINFLTTFNMIPNFSTLSFFVLLTKYYLVMCVLNSTRKRTNRLQYSVCKCEVESTGKWSNIGILLNQPHFNLVPKVWEMIEQQKTNGKRYNEICKLKGTKVKESTKPNPTTHTLGFHLNTQRTLILGCYSSF
jgi:hypothetical protein